MALRVMYTAGPTHEPIDAVRFLGNRSSGTLGVALAADAAKRGWSVRLLLGPVDSSVAGAVPAGVTVDRFETARDLAGLMDETGLGDIDALVMAAAVADYEPDLPSEASTGKVRRGELDGLRLRPTPDLIGAFATRRGVARRPALVAFALEPDAELEQRAAMKLHTKGVDMVVANALETIGAEGIRATLVEAGGGTRLEAMPKAAFAGVLNDAVARVCARPGEPAG